MAASRRIAAPELARSWLPEKTKDESIRIGIQRTSIRAPRVSLGMRAESDLAKRSPKTSLCVIAQQAYAGSIHPAEVVKYQRNLEHGHSNHVQAQQNFYLPSKHAFNRRSTQKCCTLSKYYTKCHKIVNFGVKSLCSKIQ